MLTEPLFVVDMCNFGNKLELLLARLPLTTETMLSLSRLPTKA